MVGTSSKKRARAADSDEDDNAFDDGEDLMARAASMMDFEEEDSADDDDDSDELQEEEVASRSQTQKNKKKKVDKGKRKADDDALLPDEDEGEIRSLLQLQIEALLSSVRCPSPSSSKARPLANLLQRLTQLLKSMKSIPSKSAAEAVKSLKEPLPFSTPLVNLAEVNWQLANEAPSDVKIGGSWAAGTSCKWKGKVGWVVEVYAEMSSTLFQEKDVRDYRYYYNRAYFLACLKQAIEKSGLPVEASYSYLGGNQRKPIIELLPVKDGSDCDSTSLRCAIHLIPTYASTTLQSFSGRLHPSRPNLRPPAQGSKSEQPTPIYNSDIAADGVALSCTSYLQSCLAKSAHLAGAILLAKIWSKQRGHSELVGLPHIEEFLPLLLAYMVSGDSRNVRRMPQGSSAWQLFKGCLDFLGKADYTKFVVTSTTASTLVKVPTTAEWAELKQPVLVDPSGLYNLLAETPLASLELLSYHARRSVQDIYVDETTSFQQCFMTPIDQLHVAFDQTARIHVPISRDLDASSSSSSLDASSSLAYKLNKIANVLRRALGDRIRVMSLMHASQDAEYAKTASVDIGLVMEPSQAARVVEYGPAADQATEVQAFKSFWGSKAETRRFKDGRILESVVWDADTPSERTNIWKQIVAHILQHHLQIPPTKISFFAGLYDPFLVEAPQARHLLYTVDPSTTGFGPLISAFDSFAKDLKSLEGLPLSIKNVSAMSEGLRYASVFVPGQIKVKALSHASSAMSYLPAQEVLISFEGSGKWPEDLEALQKVKSAFLVRLGDLYRSTNHGSRCDMFFDIQASPSSGPCALDIMTLEGFVFRVRIHHERERQLLQDALLEEESLNSERKDHLMSYYRTFVARPAHHAAMSALQHRHTSLSSTIRIVKRWMASHLLLPHIAVELVELLCAYVYLDRRSVYDVPASGSCGFARVLALLATWKWREEPLLVPLFTSSSADAASTRIRFPLDLEKQAAGLFANMRKMDPAVSRSAWVIATEEQLSGQVFGSPSRIIAARLQELARVCSLALADATATGTPEVEHLFTPPLEAFDFVLHLDPSRVSRHHQALRPTSKALSKHSTYAQSIRPGFDPVKAFVQRAEAAAGDSVIFFYDPFGGLAVCGLINPSVATKQREFRITLDYASKPLAVSSESTNGPKGKAQVALDPASFLRRLIDMSEGLVLAVTTGDSIGQ